MTSDDLDHAGSRPLAGDSGRQARASLAGYLYQILHSLLAWTNLSDDEELYLEGAEDFDQVRGDEGVATQVKSGTGVITLRSEAAIEGIKNYWLIKEKNVGRRINYRLITRATIGVEKGSPFGAMIAGLEVWRAATRDPEAAEQLRGFLIGEERYRSNIPATLVQLLLDGPIEAIRNQLFSPIAWDTNAEASEAVRLAVEGKLVSHGDRLGFPPSASRESLPGLLEYVLTAATDSKGRPLTRRSFCERFEELTTVRVPRRPNHAAQLSNLLPELPTLIAEAFPSELHLSTAASPVFSLPDLPPLVMERSELVHHLNVQLLKSGALVLHGSIGSGKSTLAKLVARTSGEEWKWVTFSSLGTPQVRSLLLHILGGIGPSPAVNNVVLDDLTCEPDKAREYETELGALVVSIKASNGSLIITSQNRLSERTRRLLDIPEGSCIAVPFLEEAEIESCLTHLGYTGQVLAPQLAKFISIQTLGHPQLVHARIRELHSAGWPRPRIEDLVSSPPEVVRERDEARHLMEVLSESRKQILLRLSVVSGFFRRDHALAISSTSSGTPGYDFDALVGPWIEPVSGSYFRVSPLLFQAGNSVWPKDQLAATHREIGAAILSCRPITAQEASLVLLESLSGESPALFANMLSGIAVAPESVWKQIAEDVEWLLHVEVSAQTKWLFGDGLVLYLFRLIQFMIACERKPERALGVLNDWDKESRHKETTRVHSMERLMLCAKALLAFRIQIPASQLIGYIEEISGLQTELLAVRKSGISFEGLEWAAGDQESIDVLAALSSFIVPRCNTIAFLRELLDCLEGMDPVLRSRVLKAFSSSTTHALLLVDQVWTAMAKESTPDWVGCLDILEKTRKCAITWESASLASAAARGIAVICDEYLNNPARSLQVLDDHEGLFGTNPESLDERATILLHQEKYSEALRIWNDLMPTWRPPITEGNTTPVFSCRKAAIACSKLGDWGHAAEFLLDGARRAEGFQLTGAQMSSGFLGDAAFALWKCGAGKESIGLFIEAVGRIEKLQDTSGYSSAFGLRKLVGHALMWILSQCYPSRAGILAEPGAGMCSNPEPDLRLRELQDTPLELIWLHLEELEFYVGTNRNAYQARSSALRTCRYPVIRWFQRTLDIQAALEDLEVQSMPVLVTECWALNRYCVKMREQGWGPEQPDDGTQPDYKQTESGEQFISRGMLSALCALVAKGLDISSAVMAWKQDVTEHGQHSSIGDLLDSIESLFAENISTAIVVLQSSDGVANRRLVAAIRILSEDAVFPNALFYAHVLLATSLLHKENPWRRTLAKHLVGRLQAQWLMRTETPAALRMPRITIPQLVEACSSNEEAVDCITGILLAAAQAVDIHLPEETRQAIRDLPKE